MRYLVAMVFSFLIVSTFFFTFHASQEECSEKVNIDLLLIHDQKFNGKVVRVSGFVVSDFSHMAVIMTDKSSKEGLALAFSETSFKNESVRNFANTIYRNPPKVKHEITAEIVGTYRYELTSHVQRYLDVKRVLGFKVVRDLESAN